MSEPGALYRGLGRESESASRNWDKKTEECQGEAGSKQPSLAGAHPLKTDGEVADGGQPPLPAEDILRTVAIFRLINPEANIRLAAGRKLLPENGATAFQHGASASITGNMLTTSGTTIKEDLAMLEKLGLTNK